MERDPMNQELDDLRATLEQIKSMSDSGCDNPRLTLRKIRAIARATLKKED